MATKLVSVEERFDFLAGHPVEQLWVWGPVRLVVHSAEPSAYIEFERGAFTDSGGSTREIDGAQRPREAAPLLDLIGRRVSEATVADGVLSVRFDDGSELRARPTPGHESWTVAGDGRVFQCMADGEIDSW